MIECYLINILNFSFDLIFTNWLLFTFRLNDIIWFSIHLDVLEHISRSEFLFITSTSMINLISTSLLILMITWSKCNLRLFITTEFRSLLFPYLLLSVNKVIWLMFHMIIICFIPILLFHLIQLFECQLLLPTIILLLLLPTIILFLNILFIRTRIIITSIFGCILLSDGVSDILRLSLLMSWSIILTSIQT